MRPTFLEVNLTQLERNIEAIRARVAPAKVMPMVKANAYGHGVDGVAPFIEPFVDYFGVAVVEEGIHLRELGIKKPILVAGGTLTEQLPLFAEFGLTLTGSSIALLSAAEDVSRISGRRIKTHLKFDTGMERIGLHEYEAEEFIEYSLRLKHIDVEGIYTHLANSELADRSYSLMQLERFQEILRVYETLSEPPPALKHMNNSGGILNLPEANFDMARAGILFYGVYPGDESPRDLEVKPALKWKSKVAYSKRTQPGRSVSYGSLWQAETETRIVTIPCGYADGYFRRMTNKAQVVIRGRKYPQVGRICMDQFMANVGDDAIETGDEALLMGDGISTADFAEWMGTNEYEVLTSISARVPRLFVNE
ncbi:MAG TPA: alanine racemase [Anaerolineales bacterium]|jgi:alanine racemase|nr:alanine racemase [Anaerolineales bacterium]HQX16588.1 alanine racemase [Anaerolineales bacterium]